MNKSAVLGTAAGCINAATMYVISEKGLESGPFLYGKSTDSRVFGENRRSKCFEEIKNVKTTDAKAPPAEFGPRGVAAMCVVNLNDVLWKYKRKLPGCGKLEKITPTTSEDQDFMNCETATQGGKNTTINDAGRDGGAVLLPGGKLANEEQGRTFFIPGCENLAKSCLARKDLPRLEGIRGSISRRKEETIGTSRDNLMRDRGFISTVHERKSNPEEVGRLNKATGKRSGELLLLKRISSSREKHRYEREKTTTCSTTAGKTELPGRELRAIQGPRKQLITTEAKDERPVRSLGRKVSNLKLPDLAAMGLTSKGPLAFELKDYDRWSRRHKKISSNLFSTEGVKSGKSLLPAITKKC